MGTNSHPKHSNQSLERFAQRLRLARQRRQLSQAELGELAQINVNQISRYERATVAPTADILFRLAEALQVTVGELMDEDPRAITPADDEILERLRQIEKLPREDQIVVKRFLDAFLTTQRVRDIASISMAS